MVSAFFDRLIYLCTVPGKPAVEKPAFDNLVNHTDDQAKNHTAPEKPPEPPGSCKHGDIREKPEKDIELKRVDEEETTNKSMSTDSSGVL